MADVVAGSAQATYTNGAASLTSGSATLSGSDRLALGITVETGATGTAFKFGGSSGTDLTQIGAAISLYFGTGSMELWARAPGPAGSSTTYYSTTSTSAEAAMAGIVIEGADQTTPFGTPQVSPADQYFDTNPVAPLEFTATGLIDGQLVIALLGLCDAGGKQIVSIEETDDTTLEAVSIPPVFSGSQPSSVAILSARAVGTTCTFNVDVTTLGSGGNTGYGFFVLPIIDAAGGGGAVFNPLTGRGGGAAQPLAA